MENQSIANVFYEMGDLLQIAGGDQYRIRAFRRIAKIIESQGQPIAQLLRFQQLAKIPGIGTGALNRIKRILASGTCPEHTRLLNQLSPGIRELLKIKGLGPGLIRVLHSALGVTTVDQLELAARSGKLAQLRGISSEGQQRILRSIDFYRRGVGRLTLEKAISVGMSMVTALAELPQALMVELAGSVRRRRSTIGDLDILVAADDGAAIASRFLTLPQVRDILWQGTSRCSIRLTGGQQVDLRVIAPHSYGAALHYFTGSKQHNIYLRARANRLGLKISEHGVFRRDDETLILSGNQESDIFSAVGLPFIPPEIRENDGELEAAAEGRLPRLVEEQNLLGELHLHSSLGAGSDSPEAMVDAARQLGLRYVAITDRADRIGDFGAYLQHLRQLDQRYPNLSVLAGLEVAINLDGMPALEPTRLQEFDWVVGVIDDGFDLDSERQTRRMISAINSGLFDCIGRPRGRILNQRDPIALDLDRVLKAARSRHVTLEVNGRPERMDLDPRDCRHARELGAPVLLSSDADRASRLAQRFYALACARRGWLEPRHVLNCYTLDRILQWRSERQPSAAPLISPAAVDDQKPAPVTVGESKNEPTLEQQLAQKPLAPELIGRLEQFLKGAPDPPLEQALKQHSDNPLARAFALLTQKS